MSMFESIRQGLQEAIDFAEGKPVKALVHNVSAPDVKALREHVGMTQAEFESVSERSAIGNAEIAHHGVRHGFS
jgi:DNA-binding transcriptional regulator YiaG